MFPGRDLKIFINDELIAAARTKGVSLLREPIDETDGESNGWQFINEEPDVRSVSVSCSGVATAANFAQLLFAWETSTELRTIIGLSDGSTIDFDGLTVLTSLSNSGETGGFVNFSATFELGGSADYIRIPVLLNLNPNQTFEGEDAFVLTVTGRNFRPDTVVYWEGMARVTTFVNATTLLVDILETDIESVGEKIVYAEHPGAIASNELPFTVIPSPDVHVIVAVGNGISARSLDGGRTWANSTTPIFVSSSVRDDVILSIYDSTRKTFLAFGGNGNRSVWRSTDGGDNWTETQNQLPSIAGINIIDGVYVEEHDVIVLGLMCNSGTPKNMIVTSQDGGATWVSIHPPGATTAGNDGVRAVVHDSDTDTIVCMGNDPQEVYYCAAADAHTAAEWIVNADDAGEVVSSAAGSRRAGAYFPPTGRAVMGLAQSSSFQPSQCFVSQPSNDYAGNWFVVETDALNNGDSLGFAYFPPLGMMVGIWDAGTSTGATAVHIAKTVNPHSSPWSLISQADTNMRSIRYITATEELLIAASGRFFYTDDVTTFTEVTHSGAWLDVAEGFFTAPP